MRTPRLFLLLLAASTLAACSRQSVSGYYVVDPNTGQPVAMVQQPYAQQRVAQQQAPASDIPNRGLFTEPAPATPQVYAPPQAAAQYGGAGGPYVPANNPQTTAFNERWH